MNIWRGWTGFIDDAWTGNPVLCPALLRRSKQQGYQTGSRPCNLPAFRMFLPLAGTVGSARATRTPAIFN